MSIAVKRVYETPARADGCRVLVDRLWPRGLSKEKADIDVWLREVAPSAELRRWFAHDPEKWHRFCRRYARELDANRELLEPLFARARAGRMTLLYGARDERFNNAVALRDYLARIIEHARA